MSKARSRWVRSAWLHPEFHGKLHLQTAAVVGRQQCWPAQVFTPAEYGSLPTLCYQAFVRVARGCTSGTQACFSLLALPSETGVDSNRAQSLAKFARSTCQSLRSLLVKQVTSKLQLQPAGVVGRHSNAGLRRCSDHLSLKQYLEAPVPLLLNPRSKASRRFCSVWFGCWLRLKTTWRLPQQNQPCFS